MQPEMLRTQHLKHVLLSPQRTLWEGQAPPVQPVVTGNSEVGFVGNWQFARAFCKSFLPKLLRVKLENLLLRCSPGLQLSAVEHASRSWLRCAAL
eukprot:50240-Pelagomonas_calceolata.AAC.10